MSRPELVVAVADLDRGPKQVEFVLSEAWLRRALESTDATILGPGKLDVTLSKNSEEVLVRGQIEVDVTLPCVVSLDPVPVSVRAAILLMLSPEVGVADEPKGMHAGGRRRGGVRPNKPEAGQDRPDKQQKREAGPERAGRSKSLGKPEGHWEETAILTDQEAGRDTFDGHEVVLDGFVREFLILELPMFPRRSDLPTDPTPANPPLPADSQASGEKPLDPRLSPLAELKSRLEKMKKE
jgi:uncharacterized metal-binding protein YceD (DUF177 family)